MKMKISEYAKLYKVSQRTVWNWIQSGKIQAEKTPTGNWRVIADIKEEKKPKLIIYARVSSSENKTNLDKQAERLHQFAIANGWVVDKIVKEIGSGVNDKRPKLQQVLAEHANILVEHKDRLTRFGFNYIEFLLNQQNRKIIVVNNLEDMESDIVSDFTSIITSFCARIYGLRRSKRKTEELIAKLNESEN